MTSKLGEVPPVSPAGRGRSWLYWLAAGCALAVPCLFSLADFVLLAREGGGANLAQQAAYAVGNIFLIGFPILCVWLQDRRFPRPSRPQVSGLALGAGFGLVVGVGTVVVYFLLRDTAIFGRTPAILGEKLGEFGLRSPAGFAAFAVFITLFHSLLEEYYWRWFVFGWLRRRLPFATAAGLSGLAFMAHHIIVLDVYMPGQFWLGVVPFSLCVAVGGVAWAWLYERTGSIYAPWISHMLVDAALFVVGYDLFFVR